MKDKSKSGLDSQGNMPLAEQKNREGWHTPKPETIPAPTYWPVVLAFGVTLMGFGVLTSYLISLVGLVLFILALSKWIGELCREQ